MFHEQALGVFIVMIVIRFNRGWWNKNNFRRYRTCSAKQGKSERFDRCDRPSNLAQIWSKSSIFQPMWPWNLMYDLENNRAPLLYYIKLCVSFQIIGEFKLKLHSGNAQFGSKLAIFLCLVTWKFDRWPWKTIWHLFYTTSSFVHHFKSIGEFKLDLQSGNAQFGSKSAIFCPVWLWNLTDDLEKQ